MRIQSLTARAVLLALLFIMFYACRHQLDGLVPGGSGSGGGYVPPPTASNCSPDTVYFVNDILPIISSNCTMSGCHDNTTHADGVNLTTYAKIMQYVKAGNAANSKLYSVITRSGERMPPPPMPALTADQKAKIQKWINQGARNNNCTGRCDTASFTFTGAIKPMMNDKCAGCHNPSNLGGNIDLTTYAGVKAVATNGKLYGSIAQQPGYSPMPKNGLKLSDCEIRQVQKWINAGTPNN